MISYCIKSRYVFPGNAPAPFPASVLIEDDKIAAVVSYGEEGAFISERTQVIDCKDRLVMPGFVDAHTHFFYGALSASDHVCEDISASTSEEECAQMVFAYAKSHPDAKRIRGRGWFITNWDGAPLPTKKSLDQVLPDIPVYLQAADCHSYWLNSAALKECGIDPDMQVKSGYIGKLENGELSGLLVEMEACAPADAMYQSFEEDELKEIYRNFLKKAAASGITSMSEMMPSDYTRENQEKYKIIKGMEQSGELTVRLHIFTRLYNCRNYAQVFRLKKEFDSDYLRISGLKGFIDGVTETYTGYLLKPYTDWPDTCGIGVPVKSQDELNRCIIEANREGLPVRIHCIADGSVRMALNAFEASVRVNGKFPGNTIEHIENIDPADIPRFRELGVQPSMQPMHLLLDAGGKVQRIGKERIRYEWMTKTLLDSCGSLALGTDYPVVSMNPFDTLYAAVTRKNFDGSEAGCNPEEKLTMGEALKSYTYAAAAAYSRQNEVGSLEKGKFADLIVVSQNLFHIPEQEIRKSRVLLTMTGGKIVYRANDFRQP